MTESLISLAELVTAFFTRHLAEDDHFRNLTVGHLRVPHRVNLEHGVLTVVEIRVHTHGLGIRIPEVPVIDADFHRLTNRCLGVSRFRISASTLRVCS